MKNKVNKGKVFIIVSIIFLSSLILLFGSRLIYFYITLN